MFSRQFERYIGIDYSGAGLPTEPQSGIQVRLSRHNAPACIPEPVHGPHAGGSWSRASLAVWLCERLAPGEPRTLIGLDHAFSFPAGYFSENGLNGWDTFLEHFDAQWGNLRELPIHGRVPWAAFSRWTGRERLRVTEQFTASAKSVFQPVGPGVAYATFAGLPWLRDLRRLRKSVVHFWPFDGWDVAAGYHVIAEVYPSLFANRYDRLERSRDGHDAYSVCRWLSETDHEHLLPFYTAPNLAPPAKAVARLEGWILGVA